MKWGLTIGAICLAATAVVVGGDYMLAQKLTDAVQRQMEAKTGLEAHFAETHLGFWPALRFSGTGLRLSDADPARDDVLSVNEFSFDLEWTSLFSGRPHVTNLALAQPHLTLVEDAPHKSLPASRIDADPDAVIDLITIRNGSINIQNRARKASAQADALNLKIDFKERDRLAFSGLGRFGSHEARVSASVRSLRDLMAVAPTDIKGEVQLIDLSAALPFHVNVQLLDKGLRFESIADQAATDQIKASGALDWSKDVPFLRVSLTGDALDLSPFANIGAIDLIDHSFDLNSIKLIDASFDASFSSVTAGALKARSVTGNAGLNNGALKAAVQAKDFYQGTARATLSLDGAQKQVGETFDLKLDAVSLAPLLADLSGLTHVEGTLDMAVNLHTNGATSQDMASALAGSSDIHMRDGAITQIDAPSSLRAIAAYLPANWASLGDRIDIGTLDAHFAVNGGVASTDDVHIVSPLVDMHGRGSVNLTEQTYDLRFEPKFIMRPAKEAQPGRQQVRAPLDLGAAILVQGPWTQPQVSADLSGLMKDPKGVLEKLGTLGLESLGQSVANDSSKQQGSQVRNEDVMKGVGDLLDGFLGAGRDSGRRQRNR